MNFSELTKGWVRIGDQVIDLSKICYIVKGNYDKYTAFLSSGHGIPIPAALVDLVMPYLQELKTATTKINEQGHEVGGGPYITEQPRPLLSRDTDTARQEVEHAVANNMEPASLSRFILVSPSQILDIDTVLFAELKPEGVEVTLIDKSFLVFDSQCWDVIKKALL